MEPSVVFSTVLNTALASGTDLQGSLSAAADSVAFIYLDSESSAAIGSSVGQALNDDYVACLTSGADEETCSAIFQKGPTATLLAVQTACDYECGVDDSGWDYDDYYETGRLIFEIDNACRLDVTTQRVTVRGP